MAYGAWKKKTIKKVKKITGIGTATACKNGHNKNVKLAV